MLGTLACWLLAPLGASQLQLVLYFPVIVLSALLAGLGPGILATILCTTIAAASWSSPEFGFAHILQLCVFTGSSLAIVIAAHVMHRRQQRLLVTAQKLAESDEIYRRLVEGVKDYAMIILDPEGRVQTWNAGAELIMGYRKEEIVGRHYSTFFPAEDLAADKPTHTLHAAAENGAHSEEGWRVRKDGSRFWASALTTALRDASGHLRGFAKITRDLTLHKLAEEQRDTLQRVREERLQSEITSRAKDEFLATVSHELRTPLTAVLGWIRILQDKRADQEDQRHAVEVIERNARLQARLVEDLLDISRAITGKLVLKSQLVDLGPVIDAAFLAMRPAATAKNIQIQRRITGENLVWGDHDRLQQIVYNLLNNAVKFTPPGGTILISLARVRTHIEISVTDSGIGMSHEFLPSLFGKFLQADHSSGRQFGGLGIGLAIVKHLTELHGGTVEAFSEGKDQGSRFVVRLPLAAVRKTIPPSPRPFKPNEPVGPAELNDLRILVVEDDEDSRDMVATVLRNAGATVSTAGSVSEALEELDRFKPNLLLSDIGMPGEDGYALIEKIRSLPPERGGQIPAIALTAYAKNEDSRRALASGYQSHIAKPVEPEMLTSAIASVADEQLGKY